MTEKSNLEREVAKIQTTWAFRGSVPVGMKKSQKGGGRNKLGQ